MPCHAVLSLLLSSLHLQPLLGSGGDSVVLLVVLLQEAAPLDIFCLGDVGLELGQLRQLELFHHLRDRGRKYGRTAQRGIECTIVP